MLLHFRLICAIALPVICLIFVGPMAIPDYGRLSDISTRIGVLSDCPYTFEPELLIECYGSKSGLEIIAED